MNLYDGSTLAEYSHTLASGHDVLVSAEDDDDGPRYVSVIVGNVVFNEHGEREPDWTLTAAQARGLAASLILAADHADGRIG